jgi:peptide methionine sulfoxide reductase MsrA
LDAAVCKCITRNQFPSFFVRPSFSFEGLVLAHSPLPSPTLFLRSWHVQHEFVEAEKRILQRTDAELTARAGYAGGKALGDQGKVCYHNAGQIADYGNLGHAEIVRVQIPARVFPEFAVEYCNLFSKEGYRPDQFGDRGGEYRNVVGLPGGVQSKHAQQLVEASTANGDKLDFAKGKGDDPDRRALVFVMDTADFPFHVAEQYHQFHDGFNLNENYPASYNKLAGFLAKEGTLGKSDCPNGLIGIGALGL